jgi:hypothetical protein
MFYNLTKTIILFLLVTLTNSIKAEDTHSLNFFTVFPTLGDQYEWSSYHYQANTEHLINYGTLGRIGDVLIPGRWLQTTRISPGVIHQERDGSLRWKILDEDGSIESATIGNSPAQVLIGADLDGSGLWDAAMIVSSSQNVTESEPELKWMIVTDPFGPDLKNIREYRFNFGNRGDLPFIVNPDGKQDLLGIRNKAEKTTKLYKLSSKEIIELELPKIAYKVNEIIPINESDTRISNLLFLRGLQYWLFNPTSQELRSGKLRTQGQTMVGNIVSEYVGDEIASRQGIGNAVPVLNPFSREATTFFPGQGVLPPLFSFNNFGPHITNEIYRSILKTCTSIEDSKTSGKRSKLNLFINGRGRVLVKAHKFFEKIEIFTDKQMIYPLEFLRVYEKQGGIWQSLYFSKKDLETTEGVIIIGTINKERTCRLL